MIRKALAILCVAFSVAFAGLWGLSYARAMSLDWRGPRSRTWIAWDFGSAHISHIRERQPLTSDSPSFRLYDQAWGREAFGWRGLYLSDWTFGAVGWHLTPNVITRKRGNEMWVYDKVSSRQTSGPLRVP